MVRGRRLALAIVLGGVAAASCGPPAAPGYDIRIWFDGNLAWGEQVGALYSSWEGIPTSTTPIEGHTVAIDFRHLAERNSVSFNDPSCTPAAGKGCPPLVFRDRPELHLFARSPRDWYVNLITDPTLNPWPSNLSAPVNAPGINTPPYELPDDVVIPYDPIAEGLSPTTDIYPSYVSVPSLTEQDFIVGKNGPTALSQWVRPSNGAPAPLRNIKIADARVVRCPSARRRSTCKPRSSVPSAPRSRVGSNAATWIRTSAPSGLVPTFCHTWTL